MYFSPCYCKKLGIADERECLRVLEEIVTYGMKEHYSLLLKEYGRIFGKAITEQHRKHFGHLLVHPSQLTLFEDDGERDGESRISYFDMAWGESDS